MARTKLKIPLLFKMIGVCLSPIILLAIIEGVLILVEVDTYYEDPTFPINWDINFGDIYELDSKLFWRFRKYFDTKSKIYSDLSYHINSLGLRGPEPEDPKTKYRILVLGNSCAFGWGVPYETSWLEQLRYKLLTNYNLTTEVINAGIPGYTSYQGRIFYAEELQTLKPDMVLIMFGWNDHWPAGQEIADSERKIAPELMLSMQNMVSRLRLYQLLRKYILSAKEEPSTVMADDLTLQRRVGRQEFVDNLTEIVTFARNNNTRPVLLTPPIPTFDDSLKERYRKLVYLHNLYQQDITNVATWEKVPLVDLQVLFDNRYDLFDDPVNDFVHFNAIGQEITARAVAEVIAPLIAEQSTDPVD